MLLQRYRAPPSRRTTTDACSPPCAPRGSAEMHRRHQCRPDLPPAQQSGCRRYWRLGRCWCRDAWTLVATCLEKVPPQGRSRAAREGPPGLVYQCPMLVIAVLSILVSTWAGPTAHRRLAERCVSPPFSRLLLGPPHRAMAHAAAAEPASRTAIRPGPPTSSATHIAPHSGRRALTLPHDLGGLPRRHPYARSASAERTPCRYA
jgi:hypothetical protein